MNEELLNSPKKNGRPRFRMLDLCLEDRCAVRRQYRTLRIAMYAPSSYTKGLIPHYQGHYGMGRDEAKRFLIQFYETLSWHTYIGSK